LIAKEICVEPSNVTPAASRDEKVVAANSHFSRYDFKGMAVQSADEWVSDDGQHFRRQVDLAQGGSSKKASLSFNVHFDAEGFVYDVYALDVASGVDVGFPGSTGYAAPVPRVASLVRDFCSSHRIRFGRRNAEELVRTTALRSGVALTDVQVAEVCSRLQVLTNLARTRVVH
jgi:hypothetical protein